MNCHITRLRLPPCKCLAIYARLYTLFVSYCQLEISRMLDDALVTCSLTIDTILPIWDGYGLTEEPIFLLA